MGTNLNASNTCEVEILLAIFIRAVSVRSRVVRLRNISFVTPGDSFRWLFVCLYVCVCVCVRAWGNFVRKTRQAKHTHPTHIQ